MSEAFITYGIVISLIILLLSTVISFYRLFRGPSLVDRVVALDLIGMLLAGTIILTASFWRQSVYLDAVIAFSMISFLATVGIARYMEQGERS